MLNPHEHIVGVECEHGRDMPMAEDILGVLVHAYPGYQWFVLIKGGVIQVKIADWAANWGMCLHYKSLDHDAGARAAKIKRAAGEFLERANMKRGEATGEAVASIEGVPDKAIHRL